MRLYISDRDDTDAAARRRRKPDPSPFDSPDEIALLQKHTFTEVIGLASPRNLPVTQCTAGRTRGTKTYATVPLSVASTLVPLPLYGEAGG